MFDIKTGSLIDFSGKADVHPTFYSCDKPQCPTCYERGWAVREADNINFRLLESAKRLDHVAFGDVEHIIVSVDPKFWGWLVGLNFNSPQPHQSKTLISNMLNTMVLVCLPYYFNYTNLA